jgi:hypothetical protein
MNELLEPWRAIVEHERAALDAELRREIGKGHSLHGEVLRVLAPSWPHTEPYDSLADWRERRMKPDHEAFA